MTGSRLAWGAGFETLDRRGATLDVWFRWVGWGDYGESAPAGTDEALAGGDRTDDVRRVVVRPIRSTIDVDAAPSSAADVYLRLHLLSHRLAAPNSINLDGIFGAAHQRGVDRARPGRARRSRRRGARPAGGGLRAHDPLGRQVPADARLRGAERRAHRRRRPRAPRRPPRRRHHRDARGLLQLQRAARSARRWWRVASARAWWWATTPTSAAVRRSWARCRAAAPSGCRSASAACSAPTPGSASASATTAWWKPGCTSRPARSVRLPDGAVVKAKELSGGSNMLFRRHSQTGAVEVVPRSGTKWTGLNDILHTN